MKKRLIAKILLLSSFFNFNLPAFSDDSTPKPYEDDEFPQTLKDIRRFEIITIGALPFVTLDTTLAYSTYRYARNDFDEAYKPDIFSSTSFTQDEQKGIILTSVGISIGIGITDLIVHLIKRSSKRRRPQINYDDIAVIPISEDQDAQIIALPSEENSPAEKTDDIEDIEEIEE